MSWRRASRAEGRDVITSLQQEASQQGRATLAAIESAVAHLTQQPSPIAGDLRAVDGIVFLSQQLLLHQQTGDNSSITGPTKDDQLPILTVCVSYCTVLESYLISCLEQHTQHQRHCSRQRYPQSDKLLPQNAATALCSCLRQWVDQHTASVHAADTNSASSASPPAAQEVLWQLQVAAMSALAVLLPRHWPAVAAYERAAVLVLLVSLLQPPRSCSTFNCSKGNRLPSDLLVVALPQVRVQTMAAQILGQLCGPGSISCLQQTEVSSIVRALVDALSHCTSSAASSSNGGTNSNAGGPSGSRLTEDSCYVKYHTSILTALSQAVFEDKQGWQGYAGQLTEAAGKLLSYGLRQQSQPASQEPAQPTLSSNTVSKAGPEPVVAAAADNGIGTSGSRPRYVPPHLRRSAAASAAAVQQCQAEHGQDQTGNPTSDAESFSDWSDTSDSEQQNNVCRSRSSSKSAASRQIRSCRSSASSSSIGLELEQQQHQALLALDPIKSYRVRVAVLQLLQNLVQIDAKGLHPYLAALLPSQQPLQRRPLSPHLITALLYDPCSKVRQLSASLVSSLLEGPAARTLLAVAEARGSKTAMRGFTTLSVSLGQMLLSLHTGLLAAISTWQQQQMSRQVSTQHAEVLELMSSHLLNAVLRSLCCLVQVTPYDRFPQQLLAQVLETVWGLWQQLQQQLEADEAAASSSAVRNCITTAVAVHAQALSTKKPSVGVATWLFSKSDNGSNCLTKGQCLVQMLMAAATSARPLLRIEALAALRGCCINYPATVSVMTLDPTAVSAGRSSVKSCWRTVRSAVQYNIQDTSQVLRSPRVGSSGSAFSMAAGSSTEVSASTSPEDKAAQHAVKLIGDWLTAAWAHSSFNSNNEAAAAGKDNAKISDSQSTAGCSRSDVTSVLNLSFPSPSVVATDHVDTLDSNAQETQCLTAMWSDAIELLLSDQIVTHPNYMIRSAAAGVLAGVPSPVWQQLQPQEQQRLLTTIATAAADDSVTAGRAAACKVLGSLVQLPGMLQDQQRLLLLLQPLSQGVKDSAVSVRLNASWTVANACDALKQCQQPSLPAASAVDIAQEPSDLPRSNGTASDKAMASVLQLLCSCALTSAGDSEKVRANGIRAVGALFAAWQPDWGLRSSTKDNDDWGWVPAWHKSAASLLQSCLAARSMKVVWNAAYASAGLLANTALHAAEEVSACIPGLLLVLIVLVRDSSNYKIKIHAAAALGAVQSRSRYGQVYADAVLVLAAALDALECNSSSDKISNTCIDQAGCGQATSAAAVNGGSDAGACEGDGNFPNFRYLPALQTQLRQSLLHMLAMLQPSDATRLRAPLQRRKQQLLQLLHETAATAKGPQDLCGKEYAQQAISVSSVLGSKDEIHRTVAEVAAGWKGKQRLPSDPFALEDLSVDGQQMQQHDQRQQGVNGDLACALHVTQPGVLCSSKSAVSGSSAMSLEVNSKANNCAACSQLKAAEAWQGLVRLLSLEDDCAT